MEETASTRAAVPAGPIEEKFTRCTVTGMLIANAALTFVFSFGNIWALGRRVGVTPGRRGDRSRPARQAHRSGRAEGPASGRRRV